MNEQSLRLTLQANDTARKPMMIRRASVDYVERLARLSSVPQCKCQRTLHEHSADRYV